ncbi:hypothetical protein LMG23994_04099 [Cupriavidus pinatubonensis]|uniref:Uncharacterized protein n=1 Tax=Cupriavidus pinatubonensis TaxID=248026 RepID=A0ABM8XGN6_9BURK|nr:hypothetical protein LMG23994_04099 [Cupriavidus pinatubonensis]
MRNVQSRIAAGWLHRRDWLRPRFHIARQRAKPGALSAVFGMARRHLSVTVGVIGNARALHAGLPRGGVLLVFGVPRILGIVGGGFRRALFDRPRDACTVPRLAHGRCAVGCPGNAKFRRRCWPRRDGACHARRRRRRIERPAGEALSRSLPFTRRPCGNPPRPWASDSPFSEARRLQASKAVAKPRQCRAICFPEPVR